MAATLQYDDGPVLLATCDNCPKQIVAFGMHDSTREELDTRIAAEGWEFRGGSMWLCKHCGNGHPIEELASRIAAISVLNAPD